MTQDEPLLPGRTGWRCRAKEVFTVRWSGCDIISLSPACVGLAVQVRG